MPTWLIILLSVLAALILSSGIIHRHVIIAIIKHKPFKAPKWHVWLPESLRVK